MARPRIVIDDAKLKALMRLCPSLEDTAAFLECSPDTIEKYIKREHGLRFTEFRHQNAVVSRFSLIRTALKQAESGNTAMLIFCLKNLCDWRDRPRDEEPNDEFKNMTIVQLVLKVLPNIPKEILVEHLAKLEAPKTIEVTAK